MPGSDPALPPHPIPVPDARDARVVGAYAQTAIDAAKAKGVAQSDLAQALGMAPQALDTTPESLSVAQYLRLLSYAAQQTQDPCFGLFVGESARLSTYPFYGLVVCACDTFRAAFEQTSRYEGLAHDLGRSRLEESDGVATYIWESPWLKGQDDPDTGRLLCDSVMAGIMTFASWLAHTRLPVIEIGFPFAQPPDAVLAEYQRIFQAPVRFDVPVAYGRFPSVVLDMAVPNTDASMFAVLQRHADTLMAARLRQTAQPKILQDVRAHMAALLSQDKARLADVAQAMNMTARTLQRKLSDVGASYQQVLDQVRRDMAEQLFRDEQLTLTDVAFLLGYSEQSSFNRACRDWFGTTPALQRERARAQG